MWENSTSGNLTGMSVTGCVQHTRMQSEKSSKEQSNKVCQQY